MFFTCVPQSTVAVIERCGRFSRFGEPGCNCTCCCIGDNVRGYVSLRIKQLDVRVETKTRDNVFLTLSVSVQYQVVESSMYDAYYKLGNTEQQINSWVFDVVRAKVPRMTLDNVFEGKEEIAGAVSEELTKVMSNFGYAIHKALVTDIDPSPKVKEAMNSILAAQRMRLATEESAAADAIKVIKAAEASKVKTIMAAEGEAEAKFLSGQGMARQRQAIVEGLRESVVGFQAGVQDISALDVISLMMLTQYYDTIKEVGQNPGTKTLFLNNAPNSASDMMQQIRDGFLQGSSGAMDAPGSQSAHRQARDAALGYPTR